MKRVKKIFSNLVHSDAGVMLIALSIICAIGFSVGSYVDSLPQYTVKTKIELTYQNGSKEVLTISKSKSALGNPTLYNGCVYRRKVIGETMWSEDEYFGCLRCGVKYFKVKSVKKELIRK